MLGGLSRCSASPAESDRIRTAARSQTVLPRLWYIPATMETPMAASAT